MLVFKGGMSLDDYLFDVSLKENNGLSFHHHPGGGGSSSLVLSPLPGCNRHHQDDISHF